MTSIPEHPKSVLQNNSTSSIVGIASIATTNIGVVSASASDVLLVILVLVVLVLLIVVPLLKLER